jgi:hypothetical protein
MLAPLGTDPAVFESLRQELKRQLEIAATDPGRFTAKAPTGPAGYVGDLVYSPGPNQLSWTYVNAGDYDCNGEVGVADITPIALHFLHAIVVPTGWPDAQDYFIDGDQSAEIGVSDLTPIALNFLNTVASYDIITSDSENGNYTMIGSISLPSPPTFPFTINADMPAGSLGWIRVQPIDGNGNAGEQSNAIQVAGVNQPPVADFSYSQTGGFNVEFNGTSSYDPDGAIAQYEWDFESDGTYDWQHISGIGNHNYGGAGQWECTLRVTDDDGDTGTITKTVYVVQLATNWTLVDPFPVSEHYSLPSCTYIGDQLTGQPAIAFYTGNFDTGFAAATDGYGAAWGTVTTIDTYLIKSLALAEIGGNPAIAYNDYTNQQLNYCRAQDSAGTTWGSIVVADATQLAGEQYLDMIEVAGRPAIAYYMDGAIDFVRAADATGDTWLSPIQLHAWPPSGSYLSMAMVGGNPAVAFQNNSPVNPRYTSALDPQATSWSPEADINSDGDSSAWISLVQLETIPARPGVFGSWNGATQLVFYRAMDTAGTTWEAPLVLTGGTDYGITEVSAAIVGGYPCIAYAERNYVSGHTNLAFKQAVSPDGSVWAPTVYIGLDLTPEDVTLIDVRGRPAICYYLQSDDTTHYAFSPAP